ncbi:putative quinol monooxygenase [Novosphingobium mangrovi (ex Huang et al. 2023)]|uniref:Antibiotic biosynthesis monooxygenase n=1 Tax=Novosphingobium mangrovi (ex Huang et al. 2023) TaxID=2976432 RepID=A0ABT2HZJ7_9SPHN|nr:antibiotic biosynthesis monooxygenase family protein [Novosphingobium mangrovi (ex Huang et al. 2023)]MCT2397972.1 antibiotic biosynthesis monooxygenase [Novosphingobium mangrovi (ex Huang et al. 2023)]
MILVVATVRLHAGREAEYEAAIAGIMPRVRDANPAIVFYHAGKCREEPGTYRVVEAYADQEAMDRHIASESLQASLAGLMPMIADLDIRIHDMVA